MAQFKNSEHEERYYTVLSKMKSTDSYHRAVAYLFTLYKDCSRHIDAALSRTRLLRLNSSKGFNSAAKVAPFGWGFLFPHPRRTYIKKRSIQKRGLL